MTEATLNNGHQAEAQDRAHVLAESFDTHVAAHPFIRAHADLAQKCEAIAEALGELYQAIGQADPVSGPGR